MNKRMKAEVTLDDLSMVNWRRKTLEAFFALFGSCSQYACHEYQKRLEQFGMSVSMSRKGDYWDNASVNRFFRSLQSEGLASYRFVTREAEEIEVLD